MIRENIGLLIAQSLKNGNQTELRTYRAIKNEFTKYETAANGNIIDDATEAQILNKMVAQRDDSIKQYIAGNRPELAETEQQELDIIRKYIPQEPEDDVMEVVVSSIILQLQESNGSCGMKDMRFIIETVKQSYPTAKNEKIVKLVKSMVC